MFTNGVPEPLGIVSLPALTHYTGCASSPAEEMGLWGSRKGESVYIQPSRDYDYYKEPIVYTQVRERYFHYLCRPICHTASNQSWTDHSHVQVWLLAIRTIGQHKEWKHLSITDMHVTSYATHTRRREAGQTIRQWIGPKCMSIRGLFIRDIVNEHATQYNVHGMCSTHQTPAQLYQPAWGDHHLIPHGRNVSIPQMLWRVPGLGPSRRQWGCARTAAVYLQEEWAVEREDNWLLDAGSRYTVSILLYNCTDTEPDLKCRTHTSEFIVVRPYHCNQCGQSIQPSQHYWSEICTYQYIVTTLAEYNHSVIWDTMVH